MHKCPTPLHTHLTDWTIEKNYKKTIRNNN